jgi:hypothetical protein
MGGGIYMSLEEAKVVAHEKAINEGYDQLIFLNKKRKYDIKRITKKDNTRPSKLVGFVRIFYKDHQLFTRYMEVNAE